MEIQVSHQPYGGSPSDDRRIVKAFKDWAAGFEDPNEAIVRSVGGRSRSPRQIAHEVAAHSPEGWRRVESLQRTAEMHDKPLAEVLRVMVAGARRARSRSREGHLL